MAKPTTTKNDLLHAMARHVLAYGLNTASLRPLAKAAGTSDRMLIYHFETKDKLIAELLHFLAADLATKLEVGLPAKRATSNRECIADIIALLRKPPYGKYMKLWLDIVSAAGQGSNTHARIGHDMIEGYLAWLAKRLPRDAKNPGPTVSLMLTLIEGTLVLDAVGQSSVADAAINRLFGP